MIDLPSPSSRDADKLRDILAEIGHGEVDAFYLHLAEGQADNQRSKNEFGRLVQDYQRLTWATVLIHGTALTRQQLGQVRDAGAKLVWSPQSNLRLYGQTEDPYASVVAADPSWVQLVMVDGDLAYGRADWLSDLVDPSDRDRLEPVLAWGTPMLLDTSYRARPTSPQPPPTLASCAPPSSLSTRRSAPSSHDKTGRSDLETRQSRGYARERLTSSLTVGSDLGKRWSAQR